jgi:hypothetical protein
MKPRYLWFASFGMAGVCLLATGCGGGDDIPDPSSDALAASDSAPAGGARPEPAAAAAPVAAPAPAAASAPVVAKSSAPKAEEAPAEEPAATAETEKPAPDKNSPTAEMLALATTPNAPSAGGGSTTPSSGGGNTPASGAGGIAGGPGVTPSVMVRPGAGGGGPGGKGGRAAGGDPGMGATPGGPGGPPANAVRQDPGAMANRMRGEMAMNPGRPGGGPGAGMGGMGMGMPGNPGNAGRPGADKPADFRTPEGAVDAFMNALAAKDLTRLAEATALRAQEEATAKNRDMFRRIYDESLSESELSDLARKLDGFKISGENPQKSTGRVEVIVTKMAQNARLTHKVTARREKKGWGVLDIGPELVFKNPRMFGRTQQGGAGGAAR